MGFILNNTVTKKIISLIVTLVAVTLFTFVAFQLIPGDSATAALGTEATQEAMDTLRAELGLDKPTLHRYATWLSGAIKGDFGTSSQYDTQVSSLIAQRVNVTLSLATISIIIILILSFPIGILASRYNGKTIERIISVIGQVSMSIPPFFLGIILILMFGVVLKWFTPGAYISPDESLVRFLSYLILPALAIAIPRAAMTVKYLHSSITRELEKDYVRTAYSKGAKESYTIYKHVLRNAVIPVTTFLAMTIADVLAGSIIIEQVFNIPGLGRLLIVSISNRDFAVVQAMVLYISVVVIVANIVADLLHQVLDPRAKLFDNKLGDF